MGPMLGSSYGTHREHTIQIVLLPKRSNLNLIKRTCSTESNWGHFSKDMVYTIKKYQYCPLCLNKAGKKNQDFEGQRRIQTCCRLKEAKDLITTEAVWSCLDPGSGKKYT